MPEPLFSITSAEEGANVVPSPIHLDYTASQIRIFQSFTNNIKDEDPLVLNVKKTTQAEKSASSRPLVAVSQLMMIRSSALVGGR